MLCADATYTSAMQEDIISLQALRICLRATFQERDACGETALHKLIRKGDRQAVTMLLDIGCPVDITTDEEQTPLYIAAEHGHTKIVQILLQHGAQLTENTEHVAYTTPLHVAAEHGHTSVVLALIESGASGHLPLYDTLSTSPLHLAVYNGHIDTAQTLIEHGAAVDTKDPSGVTPLHAALLKGYTDMVCLLLWYNADDRIITHTRSLSKQSALRAYSDLRPLLTTLAMPYRQTQSLYRSSVSRKICFIKIALARGYLVTACQIALSIPAVNKIIHNTYTSDSNWIKDIHAWGTRQKHDQTDTLYLITACMPLMHTPAYNNHLQRQKPLRPCIPAKHIKRQLLYHIVTYRNQRGETLGAELAQRRIPYGDDTIMYACTTYPSQIGNIKDMFDISHIGSAYKADAYPYSHRLVLQQYSRQLQTYRMLMLKKVQHINRYTRGSCLKGYTTRCILCSCSIPSADKLRQATPDLVKAAFLCYHIADILPISRERVFMMQRHKLYIAALFTTLSVATQPPYTETLSTQTGTGLASVVGAWCARSYFAPWYRDTTVQQYKKYIQQHPERYTIVTAHSDGLVTIRQKLYQQTGYDLVPFSGPSDILDDKKYENGHCVTLIYDKYQSLWRSQHTSAYSVGPYIILTPLFFTCNQAEKTVLLRNQITHKKRRHPSQSVLLGSTVLGAIIGHSIAHLALSLFDAPNTENTSYIHIIASSSLSESKMILPALYAWLQLNAWNKVEADIDCSDQYNTLYTGISRVKPEALPLPGRLLYYLDPCMSNETRYAYMYHYHAYKDLPWYMKMHPSYWLGKTMSAVEKRLEMCERRIQTYY